MPGLMRAARRSEKNAGDLPNPSDVVRYGIYYATMFHRHQNWDQGLRGAQHG